MRTKPTEKISLRRQIGNILNSVRSMVKVALEPIMKNCHIVVVDHDALLVETIVDCLRVQGYEAAEATSYAKAMTILERSPAFTILIAHIRGREGVNFIDNARKTRPTLPILVIASALEDVNFSSSDGHYLRTPFDLEALLAAVTTCIASSPEMNESRVWPSLTEDSQQRLDERLRASQFQDSRNREY